MGIVAESVRASRLIDDDPLDGTRGTGQHATVADQHENTAEPCRSPLGRHARQQLDEPGVVSRIGFRLAGKAGGVHPGPAAEGIDLEPGIVGERPEAAEPRVMMGLLLRVAFKSVGILRARGQRGK